LDLTKFSKIRNAGSRPEIGTASLKAYASMMRRYANQNGKAVTVDTVGCDVKRRKSAPLRYDLLTPTTRSIYMMDGVLSSISSAEAWYGSKPGF
jgi:hypothetical protein